MQDFLNLFSPYFLLVHNIKPSFQPQCSTCCRMASHPSLPRTCPDSAMSIPHPGKHLTPSPTGTAGHPNIPVPNPTYIPDFTSAHASFPARTGHHLVLTFILHGACIDPCAGQSPMDWLVDWSIHKCWRLLSYRWRWSTDSWNCFSQDSCDSAEFRTWVRPQVFHSIFSKLPNIKSSTFLYPLNLRVSLTVSWWVIKGLLVPSSCGVHNLSLSNQMTQQGWCLLFCIQCKSQPDNYYYIICSQSVSGTGLDSA